MFPPEQRLSYPGRTGLQEEILKKVLERRLESEEAVGISSTYNTS
jgi:hypothetical protein